MLGAECAARTWGGYLRSTFRTVQAATPQMVVHETISMSQPAGSTQASGAAGRASAVRTSSASTTKRATIPIRPAHT